MLRFALIGTFFERYRQSQLCLEQVFKSSWLPDEFWVMCETPEDATNARKITKRRANIVVLPTPRDEAGNYEIIPYSHKINFALDYAQADVFAYLDNGSIPHPDKYKLMIQALEAHPKWQAVYCSQHRTGFQDLVHKATEPIADPYAKVNYTQVMHRKTDVRWTTDMQWATPNDLADAIFWRDLNCTFYPVKSAHVLDIHEMQSERAAGL